MTIIKLPDALRDAIPNALGNELSRRIAKGDTVAVLTCHATADGAHDYLVEFKLTENANTLVAYHGHSTPADGAEPIPLCPYPMDREEGLSPAGDAGPWGFTLRQILPDGAEGRKIRVEWIPEGTSTARLALEACARDGRSVMMNRAGRRPVA